MIIDHDHERLPLGIVLCLIAFLSMALMSACAKAAAPYVPAVTITFAECVATLFVFLPIALWNGIGALKTKRFFLHFLRAVFGTLGAFLLFVSVSIMPLTTANLLFFSAPLWIALLGALFFHDHNRWYVWVAILIGFAGIALVLHPDAHTFDASALIPLSGAVVTALIYFIVRWLSATESTSTILFYYAALSILLILPFQLIQGVLPTEPVAWAYLLGVSFFWIGFQSLFTLASFVLKPGKISPYMFSIIIFGAIIDKIAWNEPIKWQVYMGMALVICGGFLAAALGLRDYERSNGL